MILTFNYRLLIIDFVAKKAAFGWNNTPLISKGGVALQQSDC